MVRNYLEPNYATTPEKTSSWCATRIPNDVYRPIAGALSPATYNMP